MPAVVSSLARRSRVAVLAGLAGAIALSWLYLAQSALDLHRAMMPAGWDARYFALILFMWAAMMVGMMLPSAAPTILLYGKLVGDGTPPRRPVARTYAFAAGYVLAWTCFSLGATVLQWRLSAAAWLAPSMTAASPAVGALILIAAGLYQWTPLKRTCLAHCRSPVEYLSRHWRPGVTGALAMGVRHGFHCVGCCWALMLLLFAGGVMNLLWIAAITIFVLLEKLAPFGVPAGRLSGALLVVAGAGVWLAA